MDNETNCPICYEEFCNGTGPKDSVLNHDIDENNCVHWFCTDCLRKFYENNINKCPICRRCIYELVSIYDDEMWFSDSDSDNDSV